MSRCPATPKVILVPIRDALGVAYKKHHRGASDPQKKSILKIKKKLTLSPCGAQTPPTVGVTPPQTPNRAPRHNPKHNPNPPNPKSRSAPHTGGRVGKRGGKLNNNHLN